MAVTFKGRKSTVEWKEDELDLGILTSVCVGIPSTSGEDVDHKADHKSPVHEVRWQLLWPKVFGWKQHRVSEDGFWEKPKVGQIHMTWYSWGIWGLLLCICFIYDRSLASMPPLCQSELVSFWTYTDNVPYVTSDALFCFYYILFSEHLFLFFVKARSLSGLYNSPITMLGYIYYTHYTGGQTKIQES